MAESKTRCTNCGGRIEYQPGRGYVCTSCGCEGNEEQNDLLQKATEQRMNYNFEAALQTCKEVLSTDPTNPEANKCAILAEYKVVYVQNGNRMGNYFSTPTFLDPNIGEPMYTSQYYRHLSAKDQQMVNAIETARQRVILDSKSVPYYDVFISCRLHVGSTNEMTTEAAWAKEFYRKLSRQGGARRVKVFFSEESLGKLNVPWEPHIYAALKSSKVLLLLGSSEDNIKSPWVRNEWKRFLALGKNDPTKRVVFVGSGINPDMLGDTELVASQMINIDTDRNWERTALNRINDACEINDIGQLIREAEILISTKGNFGLAEKKLIQARNMNAFNSKVYWLLLRCKYKAFDDYELMRSRKPIDATEEFQRAIQCQDAARDTYNNVKNIQLARTYRDHSKDRPNYFQFRRNTKVKRVFKGIGITCLALAVGIFAGYSYFGISQPVRYTVSGGSAALSDSSLYYGLLTKELDINTYDNLPVTKINNGVLKGGVLEKVTIGDNVESIGNNAFEGNKKLTTVSIARSGITIGDYAFKDCHSLTNFTIGEVATTVSTASMSLSTAVLSRAIGGTNSIGSGAFENCSNLSSLTIKNISYIGANAFSGCQGLRDLTLDIVDGVDIEKDAFKDINNDVVIKLPTISESLLEELKGEYTGIEFDTYSRNKIEECIYFISKLSNFNGTQVDELKAAEELYNALSISDRVLISNSSILVNAQEIYGVITDIDDIGTVSLSSATKIVTAESSYNSLTDAQKEKIYNAETLLTARAVYDTIKIISDIGQVTISSEPQVEAAEAKYSALSRARKDLVTNYSVLTNARSRVDELLISNVEGLILSIGTVNLNSNSAILAAETAYSSLKSSQKSGVSNYSTLTDARAIYDTIKAISNIGVLNENSRTLLDAANELYASLTQPQKEKVTNYSKLSDSNIVMPVIESIKSIGAVNVDSLLKIETTEREYAALTDTQKQLVSNYSKLTDARTALSTVNLIANIGTVGINSESAIVLARDSYDGLTASQKLIVSNYSTLSDAEVVYRTIAAIADIGNVAFNSAGNTKISTAESYYKNLSQIQASAVVNYDILRRSMAIYNIMSAVDKMGTLKLGSGSNYNYLELSTTNMETVLNDSEVWSRVNCVTIDDFDVLINQEYWSTLFTQLKTIRYDLTKGTEKETFTFTPSTLEYMVVGSDENYDISFSSQIGSKLNLRFDNFSFTSSVAAFDFNNVDDVEIWFYNTCDIVSGSGYDSIVANNIDINLYSDAQVTITAGDGKADCAGGDVISAKGVKFSNNIPGSDSDTTSLTLTAGNGGAVSSGNNGTNGGNAIKAQSISIYTNYKMTLIGGSGTKGADALYSYTSTATGSSAVSNGSNGFVGGNGGSAISGVNLSVTFAYSLELKGGNAGNGGAGGRGQNSNRNGNPAAGSGGVGGAGGTGGTAVYLTGAFEQMYSDANIILYAGKGGNGGIGGDGGTGIDKLNVRRDSGGEAGAGGRGGDSGYCIDAATYSISGTITVKAASGGRGGNGGVGGQASPDATTSLHCGNGGAGGRGGDSCISKNLASDKMTITYAKAGDGGTGGIAGKSTSGANAVKPSKATGGKGGTGGSIIVNGEAVVTGSEGGNGVKAYAGAGGASGAGAVYS